MKARLAFRLVPLLLFGLFATAPIAAQGIPANRVALRTALAEIAVTRMSYQDAFNKHDFAAVSALYAPDAVLLDADGKTYSGRDAIRAHLADFQGMTAAITSSSVKVFGSTAYDIGSVRLTKADGTATTSQYLVVSRRGMNGNWTLSSVAIIPEAQTTQ